MFVNLLDNEGKEKFLELVYKVATIDGEFADEEKELIDSYKAELGLSTISDTGKIADLIEYFSEESKEIKKVVLFELYGMIRADDKIEDDEEQVLRLIDEKFGLTSEEAESIINVAKELQQVYDKIYEILF